MSTSPFATPAAASGRPDEPAHLTVTDMTRSLDFYLDLLGCKVRSAADGWVMLCCGETCFVLVHADTPGPDWRIRSRPDQPAPNSTPQVRLGTPDLRALRRGLLSAGVPTGAITRPTRAPAGEIATTDPDQHPVVIEQLYPDPAGVPPVHPRGTRRPAELGPQI